MDWLGPMAFLVNIACFHIMLSFALEDMNGAGHRNHDRSTSVKR